MAQVAVAMLPASAAITDINWMIVLKTCIFAGILSLCKSIAIGIPEVKEDKEGNDNEQQ